MNNSSEAYNRHIMNKMLWMSRNLRNFNDTVSISNWAHTMAILKNLLLPPLPPAPLNTPLPSPTRVNIAEPVRSITPPQTISFQPAMKKPLTQSAPRCTINNYQMPPPLTTYTLCLPNIASTDSIPQRPKRRKLSIPPSVDYNASTDTPLPTSTAAAVCPTQATTTLTTAPYAKIIPGQGEYIWSTPNPKNPELYSWSKNKKHEGSEEFKVVKVPPDLNVPFRLEQRATGKIFESMLPKELVKSLFET